MIKIKSIFSGWHESDKEQAKRYVKFLIENITTMRGEKLYKYINKNRISGITVEELLKMEENING